ncbi:MAG TPA: transcriptional regulator [Pseudolabrys sp.]
MNKRKKLASKARISEYFSRAVVIGAFFIALSVSSARAAELVMFQQAGCQWCEVFNREIAPIYGKTEEGLRAPLRRVDTSRPLPPDLAFVKVERLTPLFVLVDGSREIGRIRGYPGEENFWGLLGALLKKLDASDTGGEHAQLFDRTLLANN